MASGYVSWAVYSGTILEHRLAKTKNGDPQLVLQVKLKQMLRDRGNAKSGVDCEPEDKTVYLSLKPDFDAARKGMEKLHSLGFKGSDISTLHPQHPKAQSLTGRDCYVQVVMKENKDWWYLFKFEDETLEFSDLQNFVNTHDEVYKEASKSSEGLPF